MDNPAPSSDPAKNPPVTPEEKLLHARTFLENYGKYFPLIPPLFLIVVLAGVYFVVNNTDTPSQTPQLITPSQSIPTTPPTSTENPTTNWTTYVSSSCPISIQYPNSWNVIELNLAKGIDYTANSLGCFKITSPKYHANLGEESGGRIYISRLTIGTVINKKKISTFDDYLALLKEDSPVINLQEKRYGAIMGNQYETSGYFGETNFAFVQNNNLYIIDWNDSFDDSEKKLIDQILSTFKFTDKTADTNNWKTYSYQNMSFKYPSDWKVIFDAKVYNQPYGFSLHVQSIDATGYQPDGFYLSTYDDGGNYREDTEKRFLKIGNKGDDRIKFEADNSPIFANCAFYSLSSNTIEICNQILSTFKFLDQATDINEWKAYTANGYSFKYPSDWKVVISDYLNTVSITNAASTVEIKVSDSNYAFGQSGPVEATSEFIQLEVFDTMYTVEETTINNSSAYVGFKTDTNQPLYILFGTGYPASEQKSLKDYEDSKSTILKILSTFNFTQ